MQGRTREEERSTFVVFRVGDTRCALPQARVARVLPMPRLARPPGLPASLQGFLDLGGQTVPVVALDRLFGLAGDAEAVELEATRHLLLPRESDLALRVDRVLDVTSLEAARIEPVSDDLTLRGCVVASWREADGTPVHVLSLERLLSGEESERLAALAAAEQARVRLWEDPEPAQSQSRAQPAPAVPAS